jgi:hypothetical protein
MVVKETLEKACYYLERIEETYGRPEMIYELNSFLSTIASVPEHLLEDYNIKYSLNISDDEKLIREFEERANSGNLQAITFSKWWKDKYNKFKNDKLCSLVIGKRHISIHRRTARPDLVKVELVRTLHASVAVEVRDSQGRIRSTYKSPEPPKPEVAQDKRKATVTFSFKEYPDGDILEICRKILDAMEKLVEEANSRFP